LPLHEKEAIRIHFRKKRVNGRVQWISSKIERLSYFHSFYYPTFFSRVYYGASDHWPWTFSKQLKPFQIRRPKKFPMKKTAFLSGTSNFFGPSYFEPALVLKHIAHFLHTDCGLLWWLFLYIYLKNTLIFCISQTLKVYVTCLLLTKICCFLWQHKIVWKHFSLKSGTIQNQKFTFIDFVTTI